MSADLTPLIREVSTATAKIDALTDTVKQMDERAAKHMEKLEQIVCRQNERLRLTEAGMTRLNLVVFGIGGAVGVAVLASVLRLILA